MLLHNLKLNIYCIITLILLSNIGCIPNRNEKISKKFKIGFAQLATNNEWRREMIEEMQMELLNYENVDLIIKDAAADSKKQINQIQELIDSKIDLLIVSPNESEPLKIIIEKVFDLKIPVIMLDRNIKSHKYTAFIGASNTDIGMIAGKYVVDATKGKGKVMELKGLNTASPFIERAIGFEAYIKKNKGINLITQIDYESINKKQEILLALKDNKIDIVFAHTDFIAKSFYNIIKNDTTQDRIKIIGVDGLMEKGMGLDMVINKEITATILYPTGGKQSIETAMNILNNKNYEKENQLETIMIDSNNIEYFKRIRIKLNEQKLNRIKLNNEIVEQNIISTYQKSLILLFYIILTIAAILICILVYILNINKKINIKLKIKREKLIEQKNNIIELNEVLNEANNQKLLYFTKFTHELRTPLTLILGPLEDIINSKRLHFTLKDNLELCYRNARLLDQIIDQIIDFKKIESGKMQLNISKNNLGQFINSIVQNFKESARNRNISINFNNKADKLELYFDERKMGMVIYNLISNAIKFTKEEGTINISIENDLMNTFAIIKIEDNGEGMTEIETENIFDLFYQGHSSNFKGSGLGLTLTKELILLHKGTIEVTSKKNIGTCFEISISIIENHLLINNHNLESIVDNINSEYGIKKPSINFLEENTTKIINSELAIDENIKLNFIEIPTILIIEDNEDIKTYLKNKFSFEYEIHTSNDGRLGISKALDIIPDIIITDIMMANENGFQVTEFLKNDLRTSHIPIIILTSKTSIQDKIEGMKVKADAFITKPFNIEYLGETIKNLLNNRIILRDHYTNSLPLESKSNNLNKLDRKFINAFTSIIENNISNSNLSIITILDELKISRVQLYRKVKALIGYNINDYLLSVRIQKAKFLLGDDNFSISEIAYKVGFTSQSYFSTVFKSKVFFTPSEYREEKKKKNK